MIKKSSEPQRGVRILFGILNSFGFAILCAAAGPAQAASSGSPPTSLNISGGLFYPNGKAIELNHVNFKVEVLDKAGTCVLYREQHNDEDLSSTKGGFSLIVGEGSAIQNLIDSGTSGLTLAVFANTGVPQSFSGCGSVTLHSGDERLLRVYYDIGQGYVAMTPDAPIVAAAYAMVADTLQGKQASDFLQVNGSAAGSLNQANADYAFSLANWPKLKALLDGNSTQYMMGSPTAPVDFNGQKLANLGTPGTTSDAATKGYADGSIGGHTADTSGVGLGTGNGSTLLWDATLNKWTTGAPVGLDNTKLPLAGGTMSGAITMSGFDLAAVGNLSLSPKKSLTLGNFTDIDEGTLVLTLGPTNKGTSWYNTDHNVYKIWDGTHAVQQTWLDAITGKIAASWLPDTTVVSGTYGTGGYKVPTFTVGADGRLTSAGEIVISGVAPGGAAGGDLTGTYPNPSIAANAVTNTKVLNGAITTGKLSSTAAALGGQVLVTDTVDPNQIVYFSCAANEIMKWQPTGWTCTTVAALSPVTSVAGKSGAVTLTAGDITGLGPAALLDYGTAANRLVQLDGTAHILPQLLPSSVGTIQGVVAGAKLLGGGISGVVTLNVDTGVGPNQVVSLNGSSQLPAVDGSLLSGVNAVKLQSRDVAATAPAGGQVLGFNSSTTMWEPIAASGGSVNSVGGGPGLLGGPITTSGSLYVDMGNTANKVVAENGAAQIAQQNGTAGAPSYSFASDTTTGVYSAGAGQLLLSTGGTARLAVDPAGQVGIGTTSPGFPFDVAGHGRFGITSGSLATALTLLNSSGAVTAGNGVALDFQQGSNVQTGSIAAAWSDTTSQNSYMSFSTRGTGALNERLRIDQNGCRHRHDHAARGS